ncbi:hypothetical protein ACDF64_07645 [Agromyces sp. MMS24-JH15]|uniref:hypothetical protein n=1 Tax=Agromyces sp. MMS24-JH15 TaxID=3243765 RepID=UPI003749CC31
MTEAAAEEFGVTHILVNELPADLGSPDAPSRYDVAAVFTRRPLPRELDLLKHPDVGARLAEEGYGEVALHVADRRLIIEHTNLDELAAGLATVIGRILADIGAQAATEKVDRDASAAELVRAEETRAAAIVSAAARIDFRPRRSTYE